MRDCFRGLLYSLLVCVTFACGAATAQDAATAKPPGRPVPAAATLPPTDAVSATSPEDWTGPLGLAAKKPVFAGACKLCPRGQVAIVVKQALAYYGYDVHICWSCAVDIGQRDMADKDTRQQGGGGGAPAAGGARRPPPGPNDFASYIDPTPLAVPDISDTSEEDLWNAWNGTGSYAVDNKQRHNYRIIASVLQPRYMVVAVAKNSGITDLSQLKTRRGTWVAAAENDPVLAYYGITKAVLESHGGGFIGTNAKRELRGAADVWIGAAILANTYEQRMWYEISQMNDVTYLKMPEELIAKLTQSGWQRVTMPFGYLRGQTDAIPTVERMGGNLIYVRDEVPDAFAYTLAKALDEHRDLFRYQVSPWYYDPATVTQSKIPFHPGALKYYRERGYIKK